MASLTSMHPAIRVNIPEVASLTLNRLFLEVARDFCKRTRAWKQDLAAFDSVATKATYALTLPVDTQLVDVLSVQYNAKALGKKTKPQLQRADNQWRTRAGTPIDFTREGISSITLYRVPASIVVGGIQAYVALRPALTATAVDDELYDEYSDVFNDGVLARLYAMPRKPWSSQALAGYHHRMYEDACDNATSASTDERMTGVIRRTAYGGY